MSDEALAAIHQQMLKEIQAAGGRLDLVLVCTATQEGDPRRKPNIGMYLEACSLLPDIDPERSVMVGDSPTDALFAARCGMAFISLEQ
jgi:HAD superfamily hydrolase (TIGR01662 family)